MSDTLDLKNFDNFLKALKADPPTGRIGILGNKNSRSGTDQTNAEIGAKHEFGIGVPIRSFLRMPLVNELSKYLEKSGAFDEDVLKKVIKENSLIQWLSKVMIVAEKVVAEAFDSGGFGQWKPSNMLYKTNHQTLVETQQLRNSITSEVL